MVVVVVVVVFAATGVVIRVVSKVCSVFSWVVDFASVVDLSGRRVVEIPPPVAITCSFWLSTMTGWLTASAGCRVFFRFTLLSVFFFLFESEPKNPALIILFQGKP